MSRDQALQAEAASPEQSAGAFKAIHRRLYTAAQVIALLQISPSGFFALKKRGQLPFLEEIRLGRSVRYRADLVDRFIAGRKVR